MSKIILLDLIRSMQNVGAIFRNCDWAGFEKIILTGHCPSPPRNDISKTALWAQNWIDWEYHVDPLKIVKQLKKNWYKIRQTILFHIIKWNVYFQLNTVMKF